MEHLSAVVLAVELTLDLSTVVPFARLCRVQLADIDRHHNEMRAAGILPAHDA